MPRKKNVVEGAVLDLRDISGGVVDVTALVAAEEAEKAAEAARKKAEKAAAAAKRKEESLRKKREKSEALAKLKEEKAQKKAKKAQRKREEGPFDPLTFVKSSELHMCADCPTMILFNDRCSACCKRDMDAKFIHLMEYIDKKGMNKCNFCGVARGDDCTGFHFDHLNMFLKMGTIGSMMRNSSEIDEILAEVDKCQLLCISCHLLVTKIEMRYGFTRRKIRLTRGEGDLDALIADYDRIMIPVYEEIKNKFRGGGGMVDER